MPSEWVKLTNPFDYSTNNGEVYLSGEPYIAEHIDIEFVGQLISSVLIVPIKRDDKVIATLELIISDPSKTFSEDAQDKAIQFAALLADQV